MQPYNIGITTLTELTMISEATIDAIKMLEKQGQHGWAFRFDKHDVGLLVDYLQKNVYAHLNRLGITIEKVVTMLADQHYSITYGYRSIKIQLHCGDDTNPWESLTELFSDADEVLLYSYGYTWLNKQCGNVAGRHYLEVNWT